MTTTRISSAIANSFIGFSYEKSTLATGIFTTANTDLVGLFKLLGPGVIRIGAHGVDVTQWSPMPYDPKDNTSVMTPQLLSQLAAFLAATHWKIIYGLNLGHSTPAIAAAEGAAATSVLGSSLLGFEIGNEPDLFHGRYRPSSYSYTDYRTEWEAYRAAVVAQTPKAQFIGPAVAGGLDSWARDFAHDEAARITTLTKHYYRANGQSASSNIPLLLSPDPAVIHEATTLTGYTAGVTNSAGQPLTYRFGETNSFYHGGAPNVSDSYASGLWVIEDMFDVAENGAAGVNFHTDGSGPGYTPIAENGTTVVQVRAAYCGMFFTQQAMVGGQLLGVSGSYGTINAKAHAVAMPDGSTNIVLLNKDATTSISAVITMPNMVTQSTATVMQGPALDSVTGITYGGSGISNAGTWAPTAIKTTTLHGTTFTVLLPPATATLLRVK